MDNRSEAARILLVDDEARNLFALVALLDGMGYRLVQARSGEEALRHAAQDEFALVLLDVRMPGIDGFETARQLRGLASARLTPIIFLTAAADELASMFHGYEVGAVDYLVKPLIPEILLSKVAVFVDLHRKSSELAREIAERRQAEGELRDSEERLRALASHFITVREEERTHIAREIHDELGQMLTALKMDLAWLAKRSDDRKANDKIGAMSELVAGAMRTVRKISTGLRPEVLDDMGLVAALEWQTTEFQKRTGVRCRAELPREIEVADRELNTTMFRIYQELLTNVARHANATRVDVTLRIDDDRLQLEVMDNGVGLDANAVTGQASLGLLGVKERALRLGGRVDIGRGASGGTRVVVALPAGRHALEVAP